MNIKQILDDHQLWLLGGDGGSRANLFRAILTGANLFRANLSEANLIGANLSHSTITGVKGVEIFTTSFNQHQATRIGDYIRIGCQHHSISHWVENFERIGNDAGYSNEQIEYYGNWIKQMSEV